MYERISTTNTAKIEQIALKLQNYKSTNLELVKEKESHKD